MATYQVKSGDNLWSIAEKLFGDGRAMKRIMYLNGMNSTTIRPGMSLKLPTIIAGKNDRFRITDAEAGGFGLATTQQIASGQAGAGSGSFKEDFKLSDQNKPSPDGSALNLRTQANQIKWSGDVGAPIGDDLLKGVTLGKPKPRDPSSLGIGVAGTTASQMRNDIQAQGPSQATYGIGVAGMSASQMREQIQAQTPVRPVRPSHEDFRLQNIGATSAGATAGRPQDKDIFGVIKEAFERTGAGIADAFGLNTPTEGYRRMNSSSIVEQEATQRAIQTGGPMPLNPSAINRVGAIEFTPEEKRATLDAIIANGGVMVSDQITYDPWVGQLYTEAFEATSLAGEALPAIPTGVMNTGGFGYTLEDLREMGYTISSDGRYFVQIKKGRDNLADQYSSGFGGSTSFNTAGSNGGFSGGWPGGYSGGYSGGGGGGNSVGAGSTPGVLKASGSWKGVNFG